MKQDELETPERLDDAAAAWVFRRGAGFTAAEREAFERWLAADPRHAAALADYERAWSALDAPRKTGLASLVLRQLAQRAARRRRRRFIAGVASLAVLIATATIWQSRRFSIAPSNVQAHVVLPEKQTLPDGSVVELKSDGAIAVDFSGPTRRVVLQRGAAHFSVAHQARPFVVSAGDVEFRAVGTAFGVRLDRSEVELLVTEGRVAVEQAPLPKADNAEPERVAQETSLETENEASSLAPSASPSLAPLLVTAGHRLVVGTAEQRAALLVPPTAVTPEELATRLGWRAPRLEFTETPLAEAVALMNAHNRVQLVMNDAELGKLRVSGLFRADRMPAFVRLLEVNFGVTAEEREGMIYLDRKP